MTQKEIETLVKRKFTFSDLKEAFNEGRLNHNAPIKGWDDFIQSLTPTDSKGGEPDGLDEYLDSIPH